MGKNLFLTYFYLIFLVMLRAPGPGRAIYSAFSLAAPANATTATTASKDSHEQDPITRFRYVAHAAKEPKTKIRQIQIFNASCNPRSPCLLTPLVLLTSVFSKKGVPIFWPRWYFQKRGFVNCPRSWAPSLRQCYFTP